MPSKESVERAVGLLRQAANYQYFFDKLDSADWVAPLHSRGFFQNPPPPIREGDFIRLPIWVESRYLARVVSEEPELIASILRDLPDTENARVYEDVAEAACKMPARVAGTLVPKLVGALDLSYQSLLPEKLERLVSVLALGGEVDAAVGLARELLQPIAASSPDAPGIALPLQPRPRFAFPEYGDVLRGALGAIAESDPRAEFDLAVELLDEALALGHPDDRSEDYSFIWREAIEDSDRNSDYPDIRNDLVVAVRDARWWNLGEVTALVGELERREWPVLRRIALHAVREHIDLAADMARAYALDTEHLFDASSYHERVLLLRAALPLLAPDETAAVLEAIERGPALDDEDAGQRAERRAIWAYRTLEALRLSLPSSGLGLLARLRAQLGLDESELDDPDFLTSPTEGVWIGPTSPLTPDEVLSMPDAGLFSFLGEWVPPDDWRSPTPEGLGRALQEAVERDPQRFSRIAPDFVGLDATYVRAAVQGYREAVRRGEAMEWAPLLDLCAWIVVQQDAGGRGGEYQDRDPDWSWARRALAGLLHEALARSDQLIPFEAREGVWTVLRHLLEDDDPTPAHEAQYGGSNMDPVTLALNTVRGEALRALVQYSLWVRAGLGVGDRMGLSEMPEVLEALDRHLDVSIDPSLAVRSVYGRLFPWLHLVDNGWAESHLFEIFPASEDLRPWFDAAWDGYVVYTQVFDDMARVMRPTYEIAVERVADVVTSPSGRNRPEERLAEHLGLYVARGVLELGDGLLDRFFDVAPPALRGHTHQFLARSFKDVSPTIDVVRRSLLLWDERLVECLRSGRDETDEIAAFGSWFVASDIDQGWRMSNLLAVLRSTGGKISLASSVLEELAVVAQHEPRDAVEATQLIVRGVADEGWEIVAAREHIRATLIEGLRADTQTKAIATELAHELGARGYGEFRSVFD